MIFEREKKMAEKSFEQLYKEFHEKFPIEKLPEMTLGEYVNDENDSGFLWWMLDPTFGTIGNTNYTINRNPFGIYTLKGKATFSQNTNTQSDGQYIWQGKYGNTADKAFEQIKSRIYKIAELSQDFANNHRAETLQKIEKIDLAHNYKWKIAFFYSNRTLIGWYDHDRLVEFIKTLEPQTQLSTSNKTFELQRELIDIRNKLYDGDKEKFDEDLLAIYKNEFHNNEDKTMSNATNLDLAQKFAELLKNTKNVILHGAPGTGKTHLAREIAEKMGCSDNEIGFVQFHPSYDYTDFVEGIRPTTDGKFNLEDGIFKKFCEKAIKNSEHIIKDTTAANPSCYNLLKVLNDFVRDFENKIPKHWSKSMEFFKNKLNTLESSRNNVDHNVFKELFLLKIELCWFSEEFSKELRSNNKLQTTSFMIDKNYFEESLGKLKDELLNYLNSLNYRNNLPTCWDLLMREASKHDKNNPLKIGNESYLKKSSILQRISNSKREPYLTLERIKEIYEHKDKNKKYKQLCLKIIKYMSDHYKLENYDTYRLEDDAFPSNESNEKAPENNEKKNFFVFIIDEINRGELSKIFGELFFAIDPGYRGTKGKILTQYANMADKPNKFDDALRIKEAKENKGNYGHFFIPKNVYIIGTMNDIDRSVESMDLAMRRRFTFKEIKATDTQDSILSQLDTTKDTAKKCMNALNDAIWDEKKKEGELSSSDYHIGAAYFTKLKDLNNDFELLWKYNLEPLLREYLRGQDPDGRKLKKLEEAYNPKNGTEDNTDKPQK